MSFIYLSTYQLFGRRTINYSSTYTLDDLRSYGIQATTGTVGIMDDISISACYDSVINVTGGDMASLNVTDDSKVFISGGTMESLCATGGTVLLSDGKIGRVVVMWEGVISISGGDIDEISALGGNLLLNGHDFILGDGLTWGIDGQSIIGTGILSGKWFGQDNSWQINIMENDIATSIRVVPEPAALSLLALGGLLLKRRR